MIIAKKKKIKKEFVDFLVGCYVAGLSIFITTFMLNIYDDIPFIIIASVVTAFIKICLADVIMETIRFGSKETILEGLTIWKYLKYFAHCVLIYVLIAFIGLNVIKIWLEPVTLGIIFQSISFLVLYVIGTIKNRFFISLSKGR